MNDDDSLVQRAKLLGLVVLLVVATTLVVLGLRSGPDAPSASFAGSVRQEPVPVPLAQDASYVRTTVLPSGDLEVTHWIESSVVLLTLDLSLPGLPVPEAAEAEATAIEGTAAAGIAAHDVRVVADGHEATGPESILDTPGTYSFLAGDSVQITYRLSGAVTRSTSAPGRALVTATALEVASRARTEGVTHAVLAPEVLSLACAPSALPADARPCGAPDPDGGWSVDLDAERLDERVLAQVTLE